MPIRIDNRQKQETIAWLCDAIWDLPSQIDALEKWLLANAKVIPQGGYVADIGFDIRKDACGGGAALSIEAMSIMVSLGMELFLSEYPGDEE